MTFGKDSQLSYYERSLKSHTTLHILTRVWRPGQRQGRVRVNGYLVGFGGARNTAATPTLNCKLTVSITGTPGVQRYH